MKPIQKIAAGSIVAGAMVFAGKMLAAKVSGGTALLSNAPEALVNVASSALVILTIHAGPTEKARQEGALVP